MLRAPSVDEVAAGGIEAKSWLAAIVESADDAIVSKRLDGIVTSWNPAARRIFGYEAFEMIGQSILKLIPTELHPEEHDIIARIRRGERVEHYETTRLRKDGSRVRVSLTISPVRDAAGRIIGASKIARDVGALRENERARGHLAAIVDSSDDAIISKDLRGIITAWNAAAERLLGYTAEEMVGASIRRIIPPDLQHEEDEIMRRIRLGERIDHFETVRLRKDGGLVQLSLTISPVRDMTGQVVGASKIARDVRDQLELDRTRAYLAAIVESSDDAIISKDLDGRVTSWNRAAERLYGYSAAEMIGQPVLRIIPPELQHEEAFILAKVRAGEKIDHYETVRMAQNGQRLHVSLTISPIRDHRGRVIGASKIARDISAQLKGERAQAHLAAVVQSSDDAIISKDLAGRVTSWNPAAERLYGYSAEEMLGKPIRDIIPDSLQSEEDEILRKIAAGERIEHFETLRRRKDGRTVEVSITVSPIRDSHGRVVGASKFARDITAQREAQRKKDQFLAVLAHELRNPLAPVRNALALFRVPGLSEEQRERAQAIAERQIEHMARLLDDLLDVSRISTGRVELKRSRVELRGLVSNAVDATRALMEARHHRVRVSQAKEAVWLDADPVRVTQIFTNLLTNAAKYTDDGGDVVLTTRREGGTAIISVRDNGIGFAPEMRNRLFMLFSQDESAVSRAAGGLGIGLALVRDFVERHGGTVEAHSAGPGHGSEFVVKLPCAEAPPA